MHCGLVDYTVHSPTPAHRGEVRERREEKQGDGTPSLPHTMLRARVCAVARECKATSILSAMTTSGKNTVGNKWAEWYGNQV